MRGRLSRMLMPLRTSASYQKVPAHDLGTPFSDSWSSISSPFGSPSSGKFPSRWTTKSRRVSVKRLVAVAVAVGMLLTFSGVRLYRMRQRRMEEEERERNRAVFAWQNYTHLNGFYNGIRTLVDLSQWLPEQDAPADTSITVHREPPADPVAADPYHFNTPAYLKDHIPIEECFLDEDETIPAPDVFAYPGIPANMTAPYWGSYEELGLDPGHCWDRFGRFGPYGYSYDPAEGGLGLSNHSEHLGAEKVLEKLNKIDYSRINWGSAQKRCSHKNEHRFDPNITSTSGKKHLPRTAYILRTWTGYEYTDIQLLTLRAIISELSLKSGGEYDVHLLVNVKDDTLPIWASEEVYQQVLRSNVPEEFWDIATLWSEQQMRTYYPGPFPKQDNFENHSGQDVYGVYRTAHFALQWFAQQHPEYEYFWNWEMDVRWLGHYYEFHDAVSRWADRQPRKLLWERGARFWIPSLHGSFENFSRMVEAEVRESKEPPVWGPVGFRTAGLGMLPPPKDTTPPHSFEDDDYTWGVSEPADYIAFNPLFDPEKTTWGFRLDVTGYNTSLPPPPRRSAIVTISRLSRRLLDVMHEETYRMRHTMFPEMWPASVCLHHGLKAVYVPHPVYLDRKWPLDVMDRAFNRPGAPHESPFGFGEHNMLGTSFYYNAGFGGALWRRWLGAAEGGHGGRAFEDGEDGTGRMCMRGVLHHPIKWERVE